MTNIIMQGETTYVGMAASNFYNYNSNKVWNHKLPIFMKFLKYCNNLLE